MQEVLENAKEHGQKKDKKFEVKVAYNGVTKKVDADLDEMVTALLQRAIQLFGIAQNPHMLSLYREDGTLVPEDRTVDAADIKKNELLLLRQNTVKGGSCN